MTRSDDGEHAVRDRVHAVLRSAGMAVAVALGLAAVWLIVTTDTRKGATIGALLGFWAILFGAYGVFGARRPVLLAQPGQAVGLLGRGELSRAEDTATRREYEYRLAEMLRREVQACMGAELATLRADVSALRSEFVEKVGGQLRMERIETTRVIGSDIEALQHEVRQLMVSRQPETAGSFSLGTAHAALASDVGQRAALAAQTSPMSYAPGPSEPPTSARAWPDYPGADYPGADSLRPDPLRPDPLRPDPLRPDPLGPGSGSLPPAPQPAPSPAAPAPPQPSPEPIAPQPSPEPIAPQPSRPGLGASVPQTFGPAADSDPFASMPRLRPFADVGLGPIEPSRTDAAVPGGAPSPLNGDANVFAGRPRPGEGAPEPGGSGSGRHANANGDVHVETRAGGGGGRRRRSSGEDDDMLARILHREGVR